MQVVIHPYTRIIFFIGAISGAILCDNVFILLFFWLTILLPLMILTKNIRLHFNFLLIIILPMTIMLIFLFRLKLHDNSIKNFEDISTTILKLVIYTTVIQAVFTIPLNQLYSTFKLWRLKGDTLIICLGSYIVWVDIINRSDKILTARFARGFISKRTFLTKVKQLPHLFIPLIIGVLRTATERADSWEEKNLLHRIDIMEQQNIRYNIVLNIVMLIIIIGWVILNMYLRWK